MRRDDQRQAVKNIPLEQLKPFKNHPFQVRDDEEFRRLVESIEIHGVIHPAVARQIGEECYELISGHRRKAACEVLGYSEMPVLVRSMTDDEAVVNMVDANLQRETILPSCEFQSNGVPVPEERCAHSNANGVAVPFQTA